MHSFSQEAIESTDIVPNKGKMRPVIMQNVSRNHVDKNDTDRGTKAINVVGIYVNPTLLILL
jgi:hypothetical protein